MERGDATKAKQRPGRVRNGGRPAKDGPGAGTGQGAASGRGGASGRAAAGGRGMVVRGTARGAEVGERAVVSGELGGTGSGEPLRRRGTVEVSLQEVEVLADAPATAPGASASPGWEGAKAAPVGAEATTNPWDDLADRHEAEATQILDATVGRRSRRRGRPRGHDASAAGQGGQASDLDRASGREPEAYGEEELYGEADGVYGEQDALVAQDVPFVDEADLREIPDSTLQEEEIRAAAAPRPPRRLEETGLDEAFLLDLALKHVYFGGEVEGLEVADRLALAFPVAEELLYRLKRQELVVAQGGSGVLRGARLRHRVTERGRKRVEEVLRRDAYCDVAPVPYEQYVGQVTLQTVRGVHVTPERLQASLGHLVLPDVVADRLGPALHSGHALFLYGPPGNGKTAIAQAIGEAVGGVVYVPRAVRVGHEILRIYDPLVHRVVEGQTEHDPRWMLCERPRVVVGGELTLDMLEVTPAGAIGVHEAPLQVKANGGVMVVDDFGRQRCDPQVLLNRWIVPLESGVDYLTFDSGLKVRVPFDALVVFATNLQPADLVDEAFFRRIRYKVRIDSPDPAAYKTIWAQMCERLGLPYDEQQVDRFLRRHYRSKNRPLRACHPRDLLEQIRDLEQYLGTRPEWNDALLDRLAEAYFAEAAPEARGLIHRHPGGVPPAPRTP